MAEIIKEQKIDVASPNYFQAIVTKQGDSGSRYIKAILVNEGELIKVDTKSTVIINALRPDGESDSFSGVVNVDGTVTVPLTYWMLEKEGIVNCDISVIDVEGNKLTTTSFMLDNQQASHPDGNVSDDDQVDILTELIIECNEAVEKANEVLTAIGIEGNPNLEMTGQPYAYHYNFKWDNFFIADGTRIYKVDGGNVNGLVSEAEQFFIYVNVNGEKPTLAFMLEPYVAHGFIDLALYEGGQVIYTMKSLKDSYYNKTEVDEIKHELLGYIDDNKQDKITESNYSGLFHQGLSWDGSGVGVDTYYPDNPASLGGYVQGFAMEQRIEKNVPQIVSVTASKTGVNIQYITNDGVTHTFNNGNSDNANIEGTYYMEYLNNVWSVNAGEYVSSEINFKICDFANGEITKDYRSEGVTNYLDNKKADKTYVNSLMSAAVKRGFVDGELGNPADFDTNTIYMLQRENSSENNIYDEYMVIDGKWECIGSTAIDLSSYQRKLRAVSGIMITEEVYSDEGEVRDIIELDEESKSKLDAFGGCAQKVLEIEATLNSITATSRIASIDLISENWQGSDNIYSQVIDIEGITEYSKVDVNPSVEQLAVFYKKDVTFVTENEDGVVTVYCIGQKPLDDYTMQVTITEVATNG